LACLSEDVPQLICAAGRKGVRGRRRFLLSSVWFDTNAALAYNKRLRWWAVTLAGVDVNIIT